MWYLGGKGGGALWLIFYGEFNMTSKFSAGRMWTRLLNILLSIALPILAYGIPTKQTPVPTNPSPTAESNNVPTATSPAEAAPTLPSPTTTTTTIPVDLWESN